MSTPSVICAVDQSRGAERAVRVAEDLRSRMGVRLVLAHVLGASDDAASADAAEGFLRSLAASLRVDDAAVRVERGSAADALTRMAREERTELIVTASRGRGSFQTALLGSVSNELAGAADCPVVVLPHASSRGSDETDRGTVVCGVDDDERARTIVACADMFASLLEAHLIVTHVAPDPHWPGASAVPGATQELRRVETEEIEDLLSRVVSDARTSSPTALRASFGDPASSLAELADEQRADLVVVGSRGRGRASAAILGSVSAKLIAASRTPVVVVPPGVRTHAPR